MGHWMSYRGKLNFWWIRLFICWHSTKAGVTCLAQLGRPCLLHLVFQPGCYVQVGKSQLVGHLRKCVPKAFHCSDKTEEPFVLVVSDETSKTASKPLCGSGCTGFDVSCMWQWSGCYVTVGSWGRRGGFADKHVFLMQLSVSLVGGELAKLHVATLGMADWKLRPSRVPADCSCRLNIHSAHSSWATLR